MTKKNFFHFLLPLFVLIVFASCSDEPEVLCGEDRYTVEIATEVTKTTIQYGSNLNVDGTPIDLFMDIFEPVGDLEENRPVIIWAFGGAFVTGSRGDVEPLARAAAQNGFVSATIDYRILNFGSGLPDSLSGLDIATKASHDMKAAVREMRKLAANGNPHRINPDMIFVGGVSAGAITALQVGIFDENDVIEPHFQTILDANGGLEGTSGDAENLTYSSKVQGVINLSGAVYRTDWLQSTDPPIVSYHGDADEIVAFGYDFVRLSDIEIIKLYGSQKIHEKANEIGLRNSLFIVEGGGHGDIYLAAAFSMARDEFEVIRNQFLAEEICN